MLKTLLFSLLIVAICILLLCVKIVLGKRFPNIHVGGNKAMQKRGIGCAQSQDRAAQKKVHLTISEMEEKAAEKLS